MNRFQVPGQLLASLALLSLPLAVQFADAAIVPVPDAMRLVLAISVWATLMVLELAVATALWLAFRAWRRLRRGARWQVYPR